MVFGSISNEGGAYVASLETAQGAVGLSHQVVGLTEFDQEVLDVLRLDGSVEKDQTGQRTLCELFGFPNSELEELNRTLRHLIKLGLVKQLDGSRNAMRNCKKLRFSRGRVIYVAV